MTNDDYEFVLNYLQSVGIVMVDILEAVADDTIEKSYKVIKDNPTISKEEFMRVMKIEEYVPRKRKLKCYKNTFTVRDEEDKR